MPRQKKRVRNAERTRADLLDVAFQEFAEKGYDGARVDDIVNRCGVTKNVLYYYFSSKEQLFVAVLEMAYARMRQRQSEWSLADLDPSDAISKLVVYTFDHFLEEPEIISLLNEENLHKAKHLILSDKVPLFYSPLIEHIEKFLSAGQSIGRFRKDVDPVELYITIASLSYFYLSNQYTLGYILREDLSAPERIEMRKKHIVDVILSFLTSPLDSGCRPAESGAGVRA